ncbi:unnamed protein product, partial [Brenthis ino]
MREAPARAPSSPAGRQSIAERLLGGTYAAVTSTLDTIVTTRADNKLNRHCHTVLLHFTLAYEFRSYEVGVGKMCWIYVSSTIVIEQVQPASGR